jgi:hypothetical protein
MDKLREISRRILHNGDLALDRHRLHLVAAITTLSDAELRQLAQLITREERDEQS